MLYIMFTTPICNLACEYCGGSMPEEMMPPDITYDLDKFYSMVNQDPKAVVAFYGGEPLLRPEIIRAVIKNTRASHYVIQTNGTLMGAKNGGEGGVDKALLNSLDAILISIDGREGITDRYRGNGIYREVVAGLEYLNEFYKGDIIARMAVTRGSEIEKEVRHLLGLGLFHHVHWQLDTIWSPIWEPEEFIEWAVESYNPEISRLVDWWIDEMQRGNVHGIVPFTGILRRIMGWDDTTAVPCGAGESAFTISTGGEVLACPISPEFEWNALGTIDDTLGAGGKEWFLEHRLGMFEPCTGCSIRKICGGRCLFFNRERLWGAEGFDAVCGTVRHLVGELSKNKGTIEELLAQRIVAREQLDYPLFNNTTEIIP